MRMLIKGGRVVDPGRIDGIMDLLIEDGVFVEIKENILTETVGGKETVDIKGQVKRLDKVFDAAGKIVCPGLIDMHVHLREPGHEYKETIESGCLAAAHGGFAAICCMPNTNPVNDAREVTEYILKRASECATARVFPIAAVSRGLNGESLCEYGELKAAGAVGVSDDGNPVRNSQLMRRALEYARGFDLRVISHCEDTDLAAGGVMNEGFVSTKMGLPGIPNASESVMVMRDLALSELTQTPIHIAHVSARESVRAIREAKKHGIPVTCETAPHYFTLTDDAVKHYNTHAKMNPPLRSVKDRDAVLEGLADGTIDVIATDHAPHSSLEKDVEFDKAANGVIGLETSLGLSLKLVDAGVLDMPALIEKMSKNPAKILNLINGVEIGKPADLTVIDYNIRYRVEADRFMSLSRNTPFEGMELKGRAVMTMVGGKVIFNDLF